MSQAPRQHLSDVLDLSLGYVYRKDREDGPCDLSKWVFCSVASNTLSPVALIAADCSTI